MKTFTKAIKLNFFSLIALLWFGSFGVFGQVAQEPDWKWQNPLPTDNKLNDVQFLGTQTGWALGDLGTILKTTNGGSSWQSQSIGPIQNLLAFHFIDFQTGWAVGGFGNILKTTNGGSTWLSQSSGTQNNLYSVHFIDAQNGCVVGSVGTILKTSNGGDSWISQNSGTTDLLRSIHFSDAQTGWAVGGPNGNILKTSNGGNSWQNQISGAGQILLSIHFNDAQNGWATGSLGIIMKTSNGGNNWFAQNSGTGNSLRSVHFSDNQNGLVVGEYGITLKTSNGGSTWISQSSGTQKNLNSVYFSDVQNGWIVGDKGTILKTSNGGDNWISQKRGTINQLFSIHFFDVNTGWTVGSSGTILKTNNGGSSWQSQNSGTVTVLTSVHFLDRLNGWVVGLYGTILKTTNGGSSWQAQISGTTKGLNSVYFTDVQNGWAFGQTGTILKTSNGGSTWQSQSSGTTNDLYSAHFANALTGWVVGFNGTILKTNNGISWMNQGPQTSTGLKSVYFSDELTGWAVGNSSNNGYILKTTNGGNNWIVQYTGVTQSFSSVRFIDTQTGWVVGFWGEILKTSNGGLIWHKQTTGSSNGLNGVFFIDPFQGWVVGNDGIILRTITKKTIDSESPSSLLTGKLFEKITANCNASTIPIQSRIVKSLPGPYYGISNKLGNYNLRLPLSDTATPFTLQALENSNPAFNVNVVCPPNNQYNITLDTIPDTLSNKDFGFEITPCHHLEVQLASNRRRRCFQNTTSISYSNQGSLSAPDAYLLVEFPHWVRPVSASRSHVAVNDSVWRFNLDTVSAGESGSFTITDSVICGNLEILGLSQCTKATIFPGPDCPPPPGYNGAEVTVSGKCNDGFVSLGIYNKSNTDMADSVNYWVYLDSIQVKQAKVKLSAGDSLKLWVESNDLAVHLTVNQVANHPTELFVSTTVESCGDTFIFYPRQMVNRFAKQQRPNSKTHCLPVIGAYDPNDKQAFPIGFTNQNIIPPNTQLEYLVRFQNTGNDTAFTVYVIDTLDQNLNVESFEMGAASHNYQLSMQTVKSGKTFLRWQFNNIQLPDSNVNEPASNGFIQFRISPKPGLTLGSKVRNHAEIYFDFNPPIITNQTKTTYDVIVYKDSTLNDNLLTTQPLAPTLSTLQITGVGLQSAVSGGNISSSGGPTVSARGVVWNTITAPTIALTTKTQDGNGQGNFTSNLIGLQPNTLYYVRAYATNSVGTSYGEERSFTTLSPATVAAVSTGTVSDITTNSAITSNTISSDGGATISDRGVVWNTLPAPTIALSTKTQDGNGPGNFTSNLTALQPNTLYYVRAYATNSVGTSYGEERSFTTLLVGIEDLYAQKKIRLYPNPVSKGQLFVEFSTPGSLRLFDARGKLMLEETQISGLKTISISLKPGFYFAKTQTVNGSQIIKLVVE